METNRVLSSLSYLSVLFAGILFPLVVFLVTEDKKTKYHAKKALLSQLIMLVPFPVVVYSAITQIVMNQTEVPMLFISSVIITILLCLIVAVWNIVKGIKIFTNESY
ncbi:DUF4870 domain-containing protein [Cytobacillus dafuensis]|uniref:DUF4870 domain-containing protein n=1 Tax=Cytobacillus dafuensis TaxID=1742359 RepID=A0A5B8Z9N6_CYTDA|nr:DUF4870 domain-containing protein [Cytobacillus dafuensis]QED49547.1 DUF4870 domain-containing protein [Cytobacillus dafuensis]